MWNWITFNFEKLRLALGRGALISDLFHALFLSSIRTALFVKRLDVTESFFFKTQRHREQSFFSKKLSHREKSEFLFNLESSENGFWWVWVLKGERRVESRKESWVLVGLDLGLGMGMGFSLKTETQFSDSLSLLNQLLLGFWFPFTFWVLGRTNHRVGWFSGFESGF